MKKNHTRISAAHKTKNEWTNIYRQVRKSN